MEERSTQPKRRRGIYLLPNLFTTAALFAGFYAILTSDQGRFEAAALAILAAMVLDGFDGRIARLTNTQSDFGAEYDSLSDMVAFGIAPALVVYHWTLDALGQAGWLAAFVYTAAAALRLARFNTQIGITDRRYFQGLPSPAAAAIIATVVWLSAVYGVPGDSGLVAFSAMLITTTAGLLMVSNFRYYSFKELELRGRVSFILAVLVMLSFAVVLINPPVVLFLGFFAYAVSGPAWTLLRRRRRRALRQRER